MSYTDDDEPVPPTVMERALAVVEQDGDFLLDLVLLVVVAGVLALAVNPLASIVGLAALLIHVVSWYRGGKR